jgi:hypothetical protein
MKKLIAASAILGAAALLSNKARRERIVGAAKDLLARAKGKAEELESDVKTSASSSSAGPSVSTTSPGNGTQSWRSQY